MYLHPGSFYVSVPANIANFGSTASNASALTSFNSTTQGLLFTPKTTAQIAAIATPANTLISGNTNRANLGIYASNAWAEIYGNKYTLATDAAYSFDASTSFVTLPDITANRIVTMPAAATYVSKVLYLKVANSTGFTWTSSVALKDNTDANVTVLTNDKVYTLFSDGTNWNIVSIY